LTARVTMLAVAVAAIVLTIVGCGGGGDGSSAAGASGGPTITTSSLNKDEFIAQASKACMRARKDLFEQVLTYQSQHASKGESRAESNEKFADMVHAVLLPTIRTEMAEIRKLGAPEGDEEEVEEFLDSQQEAIDTIAKVKSMASRFVLENYLKESAKLFHAYGLDGCANE
jgi:hypothetical protein